MGFRFRKSISLGKGFKINLSKSGVGYSVGTKGLRFTRTATGKNHSTFSIPGTGLSYASEQPSNTSGKNTSSAKSGSVARAGSSSNHNPWVMFFICFLLGFFGVHKFMEKRTGMGFLYLFTGGLFGFGWLIDSSVFLFKAIKYSLQANPSSAVPAAVNPFSGSNPNTSSSLLNANQQTSTNPSSGTKNEGTPPPSNSFIKKILLWITVGFVALFSLVALVSGGFFSFLCSALIIGIILPVESWQAFLKKYVKGKIKTIALILLPIIFFVAFPSTPPDIPTNTPTLPPVVSTTETTTPATETIASTQSATENTTIPTTEATANANESTTPAETQTTPATETVHIHDFSSATCISPKTCKTCGESEGAVSEHSWNNATCTTPKTCSGCGKTEGDVSDHTWTNASCTAPKTCSVCSVTEGQPTDHSWIAASCSAPKTCSSCSATEGQPTNHTWIAASCSAPQTCSVCSKTEGSVGAHQYSGGNCSVCNTKDPDYQEEEMVWIPTNGGKKYHTNRYCSQMINPIQVTKSEAINRSFGPCGRCY